MERHERQVAEVHGFRAGPRGVLAARDGGGFKSVPCLEEVACELRLGERRVVDLDAFADEAEVRRGVEADLVEFGFR